MSHARRTITAFAAAFALVVLLAVGGVAYVFFGSGDAPAAVDLDTAATSATTVAVDDTDEGIAGVWAVDSDSGSFDFERATGSFAGFRIAEELQSVGSTTAVGRTGDVSGTITIDGTTLTAASFEVDLTSITTNESRRDDKVQSALDTNEHPTATFELTSPLDLGDEALASGTVSVTASGELTIHGVTKAVKLPIEAKLVDDTIVLVGSTDITFSDYGVDVPSSPIVLSVSDQGTVEVQLLLVRS
jgi:polyisoprenoid-binding protein YceI